MLLENPFENIDRSISMVRLGAWATLKIGANLTLQHQNTDQQWHASAIIQLHSSLSHPLLPSCYPNQHHTSENKSVPPCKAVQSKHLPQFSFLKEASARWCPLFNVDMWARNSDMVAFWEINAQCFKEKNCASATQGRSQQCIPRYSASLVAMYSVSVSNRSSHAQAFDRRKRRKK